MFATYFPGLQTLWDDFDLGQGDITEAQLNSNMSSYSRLNMFYYKHEVSWGPALKRNHTTSFDAL